MNAYSGYDGPTLRSIRVSQNIALRKVARAAKMSHGHLSKVERGEPGRQVTEAVLNAYQQVCGVKLVGTAGHIPTDPTETAGGGGWRRGHLSEARRRTLNAKIAAVAIGGPLGEQVSRILDSTGRILVPPRVDEVDVIAVEQAAAMCTRLDLRLGGGVCDQQARALLRWGTGLLTAEATEAVSAKLHAAVGWLGQRAGWAAFDAASHDVARPLFTIALYAAGRADDADLRAHILADLAACYNHVGYPEDALQVVRFGEVDERVSPSVRAVISGVKARAYGVIGDHEACWRQVELAEAAQAAAGPAGGWRATVASKAQLLASSGHALAALARRSNSAEVRSEAVQRLSVAADQLGADRARAAGLCAAQLAALHLEAGQLEEGTVWAGRGLDTAASVRSARLVDHLAVVRAAAAAHDTDPTARELMADLDVVLAPAAPPKLGRQPPPAAATPATAAGGR